MNDDRPTGRHPVSIGHLVMGLAFAGILGIWALVQADVVTGGDVRWLLPIPWVFAGAAGLIATAVTGTRRHAVRQSGWAGEPTTTEPGTGAGWVGHETAPLVTQPEETATDEKEQP